MEHAFCIEVFCGSGRLTACIRQLGLRESFGVDCKSSGASCPMVSVDLCTDSGQKHFRSLLREPSLVYVHFAPPCGTSSRARLIQFAGAPPILRTDRYPHGVPGLRGINKVRVHQANKLYSFCAETCRSLYILGVFFSVENPKNSFMWATSWWRQLCKDIGMFASVFDHCMYGGERRKGTLLLHTIPSFLSLNKECDKSHDHRKWGLTAQGWATAKETAYPWQLARTMAQLVHEQLLHFGCIPCPQALGDTQEVIAAARAFTGAQAGKRVLPVLPEFRQRVVVRGTCSPLHPVASLQPKSVVAANLTLPLTCQVMAGDLPVLEIPRHSKILRIHVSGGCPDAPKLGSLVPGVGPGSPSPPSPSPLGVHQALSPEVSPSPRASANVSPLPGASCKNRALERVSGDVKASDLGPQFPFPPLPPPLGVGQTSRVGSRVDAAMCDSARLPQFPAPGSCAPTCELSAHKVLCQSSDRRLTAKEVLAVLSTAPDMRAKRSRGGESEFSAPRVIPCPGLQCSRAGMFGKNFPTSHSPLSGFSATSLRSLTRTATMMTSPSMRSSRLATSQAAGSGLRAPPENRSG